MIEPQRSPHPAALRPEASDTGPDPLFPGADGEGGADLPPRRRFGGSPPPPPRRRLRLKKLRVLILLTGLATLAGVSTAFGMLMAVAAELPELEQPTNRNSRMVDVNGKDLGLLTGSEQRVFVSEAKIAPVMKHAIIAIEDERFYTHEGVDMRGIARALYQDVIARAAVQGGSTITQQFVKNALAAQNDRTLFNKLREAAVAYHLNREWTKQRILGNYLNTIYFGNGAYGIESAARTYFGTNHQGCAQDSGRPCAAQLEPHEAALLAGMVASPSGFDPLEQPEDARRRRDVVLAKMLEQGYLTDEQHQRAVAETLPQRSEVRPPRENTRYPYFTAWVKPQVVDLLGGGQEGAQQAFEAGLRVQTTLDRDLQEAAQAAVARNLASPDGPRAAMVVLDNRTGEVRAMVAGDDHAARPFNLATRGQRQPGSAFKPFVLAAALQDGISPRSMWSSERKEICVTRRGGSCRETFVVNNYEDVYGGRRTLAEATTTSDNAVYAEVGIETGVGRIARLAQRMGIRTPISRNYAMTLGGLEQGVTPLDLARSYVTFARDGELVWGTLSPGAQGDVPSSAVPAPPAIRAIREPGGDPLELPDGSKAVNRPRERRVLPVGVADQVEAMLEEVVRSGTAHRAFLGEHFAAGKTGTTENYGDAWFVGWTERYTAAVWVGYPDRLKPMEYEFAGDPVSGGSYPALIWKSFMEAAIRIHEERAPDDRADEEDEAATASAPTAQPGETLPAGSGRQPQPEPRPAPPANGTAPPQEPDAAADEPTRESPEPTQPDGGAAGGTLPAAPDGAGAPPAAAPPAD